LVINGSQKLFQKQQPDRFPKSVRFPGMQDLIDFSNLLGLQYASKT